MSLPEPKPGLVVSYSYLWAREHERGSEEGAKDRPCAIVAARQIIEGREVVTVVPVTHTPPLDPADAIEIPAALKAHLGLDELRSWIVITEANDFLWPGPDLRPRPGITPSRFDFGMLPPRFFAHLRDRILQAHLPWEKVSVTVASLFNEDELSQLDRARLIAGRRHPTWVAALFNERGRIGYLADDAVRRIRDQDEGSEWLTGVKTRLLNLDNPEDAASALAEIRVYGAFLTADCIVHPIPRATEKTPDFMIDGGGNPIVVEVFSKHQDRAQTGLIEALHNQEQHPEIERRVSSRLGVTIRTSGVMIHPGGAPDPNKPNDSTQANLISRLCAAKGDELQIPSDKVSLLWLDLVDFGPWPQVLNIEQSAPLISGNWGLTSGALWHAFYGKKGTPLVEEQLGGGQTLVLMGHDGRFRISGKKRTKLAAVIIRLHEDCLVFENPWAKQRLSESTRHQLLKLPDFHLSRSVVDWRPGDIRKVVDLAEGQINSLIQKSMSERRHD